MKIEIEILIEGIGGNQRFYHPRLKREGPLTPNPPVYSRDLIGSKIVIDLHLHRTITIQIRDYRLA
jgi:hypothetical protein